MSPALKIPHHVTSTLLLLPLPKGHFVLSFEHYVFMFLAFFFFFIELYRKEIIQCLRFCVSLEAKLCKSDLYCVYLVTPFSLFYLSIQMSTDIKIAFSLELLYM